MTIDEEMRYVRGATHLVELYCSKYLSFPSLLFMSGFIKDFNAFEGIVPRTTIEEMWLAW